MDSKEFFDKYPNKNINDYYAYLKSNSDVKTSTQNTERNFKDSNEYHMSNRNLTQRGNNIFAYLFLCLVGILFGYFVLPLIIDFTIKNTETTGIIQKDSEPSANIGYEEESNLSTNRRILCPNCNGTKNAPVECPFCNNGYNYNNEQCGHCYGKGTDMGRCRVCDGEGKVPEFY